MNVKAKVNIYQTIPRPWQCSIAVACFGLSTQKGFQGKRIT